MMEVLDLLILASPFLVVGWNRYRERRRARDKKTARTTSRKQRVEREP